MQSYTSTHKAQQTGVALIISLILLVVMTLLGLAAIRSVTQEERMAGQTYDRSLAFQAAEAALVQAEKLIAAQLTVPVAGSGCAEVTTLMICSTPLSSDTPRWEDTSFTSWKNGASFGTGTLAITPQYFSEYLGNTFPCNPGDASDTGDCKRYRITARVGDGSGGRSSVMLQSIYATR